MKLSPLDLKILRFVKFNGMLPTRELAQKLRISPATLDYKLRKLEEENVITGYKYRIDYTRIGLSRLAWIFLIADYRHGIELENITRILSRNHHIHNMLLLTGKYDIALKAYARSMHEIADLTFRIKSQLKGTIRSINSIFAIKTYKLNQMPLERYEKLNLDSSELKVLSYLMGNPKARIRDVAKDLGIHRNTASSKIKRLCDKKVIIKKAPLINPQFHYTLGTSFKALVFIDAESGCSEELAKKLTGCDLVHELFATNTDHDILAVIRTRDIAELSRFHKMLYSNPEYKKIVYDARSMCVLDVLNDRSDEPLCLKALYG